MEKKDILELRKRMKFDNLVGQNIRGCYVDCNKEIITTFQSKLAMMEDEVAHKYLDLEKKGLSGTLGDSLLYLPFSEEMKKNGDMYKLLMALKESQLKDDGLVDSFFDYVVEHFDYEGNYLILLYSDNYDVLVKTSDNNKIDESEEVYSYIQCVIAPVELSKPGLGYQQKENVIALRERDWVVKAPMHGFLFPCFTQRSSDYDNILFYNKNTKNVFSEFMHEIIGEDVPETYTEKKNYFGKILCDSTCDMGADESNCFISKVHEKLCEMAEQDKDVQKAEINREELQNIVMDAGATENMARKITHEYEEHFGNELPRAEMICDEKIAANDKDIIISRLKARIVELEELLRLKEN